MAGSATKGSRTPALQKNLSRRVSFNEASLKAHDRPPPPSTAADSDSESQTDITGDRRRRGCHSLCNSCCAWTSLIIGVVLILFILLGGIYFAFLQSNLPEVRLQRLDVNKVDVDGDTVVTADFEIHLNVTNGSGKIELHYSKLTAAVSSAGVEFGDLKLADLHQNPHTTTDMKVHSVIRKKAVEEAAAQDLDENASKRVLVIDVVVKGHIDFFVGGKRMNGLPFKIDCHSIDQTEIDDGHAPRCNTKLSPLG
ncbi:hypothetical protein DH2020_022018 [Rehmannia glutinosa]|uniref:Late embryogenesis abundant protein LEA-2 subgroup domain-containing protein n=1 Tax=Rehmannia glutinosa TaxID=99300 RepID=A0ABR0WCI5_REHGL